MSKLHEGNNGGISLLDKADRAVIDPELTEHLEPANEREPDQLSTALQTLLRKHPGPYVTNKMFATSNDISRDEEIEYDRFYFELNMLVMFYPKPANEGERVDLAADLDRKTSYAKTHGFRFLPIVGQADGQQIMAVLA